jgi:hypothetical protein
MKLAASGGAAPRARQPRQEEPEPVDPKALQLAEIRDSLDLDAPRSGDRIDEVEDPHAVALDPEDSDPIAR